MLTSHELLGFMSPALANDILSFTYESDKPTYKATVNGVARPCASARFFSNASRARTLTSRCSIALTQARTWTPPPARCIRAWLVKKHQAMLVDFLNALEIKNENGVVENLPPAMDDAKLKSAIETLLAKYPHEVVAVYLNAFNDMNDAGWANLKTLLENRIHGCNWESS